MRPVAILLGAALAALPWIATASDTPPSLAVCADPNNLPYSNAAGQGFENRIAALLAADLHADLTYFWFAEHKSFFRRTLLDRMCDVVISVPAGFSMVAVTAPYFSSTYVAVTRADASHRFSSFDDAWLRDAKIGLQLVGNEGATTPPAIALSRRGLNQHIVAFSMWGPEGERDPQGRIIDAVADGSIDVALVWGPFAGWFARKHADALRIEPIMRDEKSPDLPFVFPMALGVRKTDTALRDRLQSALDRHAAEIAVILRDAGIPTVAATAMQAAASVQ